MEAAASIELRDALHEQALALGGGDPSALERANARVASVVEKLRAARVAIDPRELRLLQARLSTQAELLARARAANQLALKSLELPVSDYPGASAQSSGARRRTHIVV